MFAIKDWSCQYFDECEQNFDFKGLPEVWGKAPEIALQF